MLIAVGDWDDAYANGAHIPDGDRWPDAWIEPARRYRDAAKARLDVPYGESERERLDLFLPEGEPHGLVVFVHGGYWVRLDKSYWSHLAAGAVVRGWAVAMPSYTLAPHVRVAEITQEIARAVNHAAGLVDGPIRLAGHSAGGHLVSRMGCTDVDLACADRIRRIVSVSGLHDLRPLLRVAMNDEIGLDAAECATESPALLQPRKGTELVCFVGATERAEFVRQNDLLANVWRGLGAATSAHHEPDRHHFDVIDGLIDPRSRLIEALLS